MHLRGAEQPKSSPFMKLGDAETYFRDRASELRHLCVSGTPWVFLAAAAFLDYLSKLANGNDKQRAGYKSFISNYLARIRPEYKNFVYKNGKSDLPVQMYHVLRCGIVHTFSLIPDAAARRSGGRDRSIVFCHADEGDKHGWTHLMHYSTATVTDSALFVAEDFADDIVKVVELLFAQAKQDSSLRNNIEKWLRRTHP
jgi:hypothetical protein